MGRPFKRVGQGIRRKGVEFHPGSRWGPVGKEKGKQRGRDGTFSLRIALQEDTLAIGVFMNIWGGGMKGKGTDA